ncbi:MAG: hypothetical protein ACOVRN_10410 [Flavobacterium sp.]
MEIFVNNLGAKKGKKGQTKYYCEKCDYVCCKLYDWNRHSLTAKHTKEISVNHMEMEKGQKGQLYRCVQCEKSFRSNPGLWKHKQKCPNKPEPTKLTDIDKDELIITLLKQNAELIKGQQDMFLKLTETGIHNTTNNTVTHTNSHNKAFNLNFFLNETCKNAMNITDFVDSIKLQLSDLIDIGEVGYVDGLSKIIVNNLNQLDETERPIHCTDKKRETMYIKDEGAWVKEDEEKKMLTKAIKNIANKNIRLLPLFREKYPDYSNSSSRISDKYDKMVIEVMETDPVKHDKIIKNISKATIIKER